MPDMRYPGPVFSEYLRFVALYRFNDLPVNTSVALRGLSLLGWVPKKNKKTKLNEQF